MPAAGRRTMPRPAVGMPPSDSCYAPAVPRGLRLCGGGFGEHAFSVPAVPRELRLCRGGFGGHAFYICDGRRKVRSFFIHYVNFFPDVHIDSFTPHCPPARGHGGGAVFSRRERTIAHGHARTARFGGASGHSRGRISAPPRRGFATLCPLAPPMVGGLGGATAAPDAGAGTRGDFDPPRQPTRRLFGLCARRPRRRRPSSGGERGDVPPLDARAPPLAASAAPSGGGLRVSRATDPPTLRAAASLTGLPPVALDRSRGVSPSSGGERGDVPPLDARAPPPSAPAAPSGGGLRTFPRVGGDVSII